MTVIASVARQSPDVIRHRLEIAASTIASVARQSPDVIRHRLEIAASTIKAFVRVAAEAGMKHIVLLSGRGEKGAERAEDILKASGLAWNIVRASWLPR